MITDGTAAELEAALAAAREAGTFKAERGISGPQGARVRVGDTAILNFCANNYLGLATDARIVEAAKAGIDEWGYGLASVRFICGTQTLHTDLEDRLSAFLGTDATILFSSCFDANGGVFESLFDERDVIVSDALNHASIIDGIRLSKARRMRYRNRDMGDLEARLVDAAGARRIVVVTDGVFSMDGHIAPLDEICALAERYGALVMVDDSHAVGFVGDGGRGTPELFGAADRVDLYTGTFGKALGGASGGYVSGRAVLIETLRQRARPYLFSNTLAPAIVAGTLEALAIVEQSSEARDRLHANTSAFRAAMTREGFPVIEGTHPIVPIVFGDALLSAAYATRLQDEGIYVTAFSFPVVPEGEARIRVQLSAAHTRDDVDALVEAFVRARQAVEGAAPVG